MTFEENSEMFNNYILFDSANPGMKVSLGHDYESLFRPQEDEETALRQLEWGILE